MRWKWAHPIFPFCPTRSRDHPTKPGIDPIGSHAAIHVHPRAEGPAGRKLGHRRYSSPSSCPRPSYFPSVAHRTRQLESWLADTLAAFRNRHERHLAYIPHLVRGMTMAEFADKYDGDVQAALRGLQKERLTVDVAPLDRSAMKRKWAPVPEEEHETRPGDSRENANSGHARAAKQREWSYLHHLPFI